MFQGVCRVLRAPALAGLGCAASLCVAATLVSNSPFAPNGTGPGSAAAAAQEAYQLAGSTSEGADVTVCVYAQQSKKSLWIPVGGESAGVHVISFDSAHDTAVVVVNGSRKELAMRKAVIATTGQAPVRATAQVLEPPPPPADAPPGPIAAPLTPEAAVKEQREARMLVSDLLEIGVQQRKAYQDAKLKAAAATPPPQQ